MSIRKRVWESKGEKKTAWVVDYVDQLGKRRLKTFKLKEQAKAWSTTALHEVDQGTHAADSKTTIEVVYRSWLGHCRDEGLERSTLNQREQHLRLHIAPLIGRSKLAELTTPRVNRFLDQLRDAGRSAIMRRKILTSLRTSLAFARGRGLVAQNVASGIKVANDARHRGGPLRPGKDFPTKEQLGLLIDRAPENWRAFIITATFTGMRSSELRGLRWADVDVDNATIHVTQRADAWGTIGSPKSAAGSRAIPLVPMVVNALEQHRLASASGAELVFTNRAGKPFALTSIRKHVWVPLQRECGFVGKPYELHSLRHAAASLFIELGWAPKRVQAVMGHSSITRTYDRYGHLFPQGDVSEDMKRLEAAVVVS
jgi:integrase